MIRLIHQAADFGSRISKIEAKKLLFLGAGGFNLLFSIVFYAFLVSGEIIPKIDYLISLLISQIVCTFLAFIIHKYVVFQSRGRFWIELAKFSSLYIFIYVVNWVVLPVSVEIFATDPLMTQIVFTLFSVLLSYFWHNSVSFLGHRTPNAQ
jgi:putative flippase GtrA